MTKKVIIVGAGASVAGEIASMLAKASRALPPEEQKPGPDRVFNERLGIWLDTNSSPETGT